MNSREGGTILIGIEDDRSAVGIEHEYPVIDPRGPTWNSYGRYMINKLTAKLQGKNTSAYRLCSVTRYHAQNKEICAITVQPADGPVFFENELYVRGGSQKRPFNGPAMLDFVAGRYSLQKAP